MLRLEPNLTHPDDFYEALIESHHGLSAEQSGMLNAKLILLLANQIGDLNLLRAAIAKAREGVAPAGVHTITTAGDAGSSAGMGAQVYIVTRAG